MAHEPVIQSSLMQKSVWSSHRTTYADMHLLTLGGVHSKGALQSQANKAHLHRGGREGWKARGNCAHRGPCSVKSLLFFRGSFEHIEGPSV